MSETAQISAALSACEAQRIEVPGGRGNVAGLLWTPTAVPPPWPLVLLGHGGGGPHRGKEEPRYERLSRRFCTTLGAAVLIIDGPAHGERTPEAASRVDVVRMIRSILGDPETPAAMAADWVAASAAAMSYDGVGTAAGGYVGFSMGTLLGVPAVAELDHVRAAVFALGGVPAVGGMKRLALAMGATEEAAAAAEELENPRVRGDALLDGARRLGDDRDVLLLNTVDDELFPLEGVWRFYDAVSTDRKRIAFYRGGHTGLPAEAIDLALWFMGRHLDSRNEESSPHAY